MNIDFKSKKTAFIIFVIIGIIYTAPLLSNLGSIAEGAYNIDWDYNLNVNHVARESMIEYGQFPLWNSYSCGGNVLFSNPYSSFLYPGFIFVLIFKEIVGLKILMTVQIIIGMYGMFLLSKHYKFEKYSAYLPPAIYFLSSMISTRVAVGFTIWLTACLIPYVFLFYLKSYRNKNYLAGSAILLALMFLGGGIYPFIYTILFLIIYAVIETIIKKQTKALTIIALIIILTLLVGAIKFLPVVEIMKDNPREIDSKHFSDYKILFMSLIGKNQELDQYDKFNNTGELLPLQWHEYAMYIGIIPFILLIMGIFTNFKKQKTLIITGIIFALIYLGYNSPINIWSLLRSLPILSSLQVQTRANTILLFCIALIAGSALSKLEKNKSISKWFIIIILIASIVNLIIVSAPVFDNGLVENKLQINESDHFYQTTNQKDVVRHSYELVQNNVGSVNCYETTVIKKINIPTDFSTTFYLHVGAAIPSDSPNYKGEVYGEEGINVVYSYWSPNKLVIESEQDGEVIINQNYHKGWKSTNKIIEKNDLIAANAKNGFVTVYYLPMSFVIGSLITILTVSIIVLRTRKKWEK